MPKSTSVQIQIQILIQIQIQIQIQIPLTGWTQCQSPLVYKSLAVGMYAFNVRGVDTLGQVGAQGDPLVLTLAYGAGAAPSSSASGGLSTLEKIVIACCVTGIAVALVFTAGGFAMYALYIAPLMTSVSPSPELQPPVVGTPVYSPSPNPVYDPSPTPNGVNGHS
jgi:hypothetical protein